MLDTSGEVRTRPVLPDGVPRRAVLSRASALPLIFGVVAVLPLAVAAQPGEGVRDTAFVLQLVVASYAGARLCSIVLAGRRRLIQGAFWLFCYLAMGVAPLAQSALGREPTPVVGPRADTVLAPALILLGMVAFDVGALLARNRPAPRSARRPARVDRWRLWLLVGFALLGSSVFIVQLGGPAVFFSSRQEILQSLEQVTAGQVDQETGEVGNALLRGFGTVPALLALLVLTRWLVTSRRARRSPSVLLAWTAVTAVNVIVNNPVSNPRYWFLTVLFSLLFTVFPRSPVMYRTALALGVIVALLIFPFADRYRYADDAANQTSSDSLLDPLVTKDSTRSACSPTTSATRTTGTGTPGGSS